MRHGKAGRKLKRTPAHRRATLSNLSVALITHKRIRTTLAKAKEARTVVEKLVTRARRALGTEGDGAKKNVHARREVFRFLRDREAVSVLFNDVAVKVGSRPGGYTRIVKLGQRHGDGAQVALLEFVDYNIAQTKQAAKEAKKETKPHKTEEKKAAETQRTGAAEKEPGQKKAEKPKVTEKRKSARQKKT